MMTIFESLLRNPGSLIETIRHTDRRDSTTGKLTLLTIIGLLIFGVTLGSFSFGTQLWAAPAKVILGVAFSAIICPPSLYIFVALTGTPLRFREIAQSLAAMLALNAALLLGFTPVLWVFSQSTTSETFFGFLVIIAWLIAVSCGSGFIMKMLTKSGTTNVGTVRIWIGIFLLVTFQMSTTLRPLIGTSDKLLTGEKRFFIEHWMGELSKPSSSRTPRGEGGNPVEAKEGQPASRSSNWNEE